MEQKNKTFHSLQNKLLIPHRVWSSLYFRSSHFHLVKRNYTEWIGHQFIWKSAIQNKYFNQNKHILVVESTWKGKGKLLLKIEEISRGKVYTNTRKLIWNILTVTDIFLNQKTVNVCKHMAKMESLESFWIVPPGGCERGENWGKIKWKLSVVNTRAVSRGQNELGGRLWSTCTFQQGVAEIMTFTLWRFLHLLKDLHEIKCLYNSYFYL